MKKLVLTALLFVMPAASYGAEILVYPGTEVEVPVNSRMGTLLKFPKAVQVAEKSRLFRIEKVVTSVSKKTRKAVNIKFIRVSARQPGSSETVPFVLAGDRTVSLRFKASSYADREHTLKMGGFGRSRTDISVGSFLENELSLMRVMILNPRDTKDLDGFTRRVVNRGFEIGGYEGRLKMQLVRQFAGKWLHGYIFKITNTSDKRVRFNYRALKVDIPNRAILKHVDHELLEPCRVNNSRNPRENSCVTAFRVVIRDKNYPRPVSKNALPFMKGATRS